MCLMVKRGCHPEIAQEDITCWKTVNMLGNDKWEAPVRCTRHNCDEVLTACDKLRVESFYTGSRILNYIIEVGFHGYTNIDDAKNKVNIFKTRTLVKCTIPAGAEYCLGIHNEIVANKMIVHKPKYEKDAQ